MAHEFVEGDSEFYEYADDPAIKSGTGDFSLFIRAFFDTLDTVDQRMINKGNSSGAPFGGVRYEVIVFTGAMDFVIDDNVNKTALSWVATIPQGVWVNLTFVRKSAGSDLFIYEGGVERATTNDITTNSIDTTATLVLAAGRESGDTVTNFMDGKLADFAYLDRAATLSEIKAFNNGFEPPLDRSAWIPLVRETHELMNGIALSNTGGTPTVFPHPPVIRRSAQILQFPPVAAAPVSNTASAGLEALQDALRTAVSPVEALLSVSQSRASVFEAGQEVLNTRTTVLEALQGIINSVQSPFEAKSAAVSVAQSILLRLEVLQFVASRRVFESYRHPGFRQPGFRQPFFAEPMTIVPPPPFGIEALGDIDALASSVFEARGSVISSKTVMIEALQTIVQSALAILEAKGAILSSRTAEIEALASAVGTTQKNFESLGTAALSKTAVLEALLSIRASAEGVYEALQEIDLIILSNTEALLTARSSHFVPIEAKGHITIVPGVSIEALRRVSKLDIVPLEAGQSLLRGIQLEIESLSIARLSADANIEAVARISSSSLSSLEAISSVAPSVVILSYEALSSVADALSLPIEALINPALFVNVVERVVHFQILLNREVEFQVVLSKDTKFQVVLNRDVDF